MTVKERKSLSFVNKGVPSVISRPKQFTGDLAHAGYSFSFPHSDVKLGSYTGDPNSAHASLGLNFELPFKPLLAPCMGFYPRY